MRSRALFAGGGIALAAGIVAVAAFFWVQAEAPEAATSQATGATAQVTRGPLLDTKTLTGTLGYGDVTELRPSLGGASAMVTWIAHEGATPNRGEPLYALDGQPAILFYGSVPQHRTLRFDRGVAAPAWVELEQARNSLEAAQLNLDVEAARLADAEARVADATRRLNDALSPTHAIAEFIQLSGAVSTAEAKVGRMTKLSAAQLAPNVEVSTAQAELAAARAAFDGAIRALRKDIATAGLDTVTARLGVAEATVKLDEARTVHETMAAEAAADTDIRQLTENLSALGYGSPLPDQVRAWQRDIGLSVTGIVGPRQIVVAPGPVHITTHRASVGEALTVGSANGGAILDFSGTDKLVVVPMAVSDQALAILGRAVAVTLPDDTDVAGTITEVGSVVTDGNIAVTIAIEDQAALGALEVASVDVTFVSDSRDNVLSVPVAALLARPEGGFAVEAVADGARSLVPVDTGLFAAGRVEIAGDDIAEGMRVGVPQ
ncbi:MAG: peptidoglycan-binding domain-containing protein [Devosia sp.]